MTVLHNRISNKLLKESMLAETEPRTTVSFYKYFNINDPRIFRDNLYTILTNIKVFGRIYISIEGINAQISVPNKYYEYMKLILYKFHPALNNLRMNVGIDDNGKSFWVLRMKIRKRIVADGIVDNNFDINKIGIYLKAAEVNKIIDNPEFVLVDMRNYYEYEIGHFDKAIPIPANTFRDQLPMLLQTFKHDKNKKIVMYCTGGIRCEKATAWMCHNGYKNIYHIEGGIIEYVRQARLQGLTVRFKGKIFVFDERMGERISEDIISYCHQCGQPCDTHVNCMNNNCHSLFIQCSECAIKFNNCCNIKCVQTIKNFYIT